MKDSLSGKKVSGYVPDSLIIYELCKTFGCLPSQLDEEDDEIIRELLIIHSAINEYERKQSEKLEKKAERASRKRR